MHGNSALPLGTIYGIAEDYHLLTQGSKPLKGPIRHCLTRKMLPLTQTARSDLGLEQPVRDLVVDLIGQQVVPCPSGSIVVPSRPHESIHWDSGRASTGTLKVIVDRRVRASPRRVAFFHDATNRLA